MAEIERNNVVFECGMECVDQVFVIKQVSEKCVAKGKSLYVAYMDLEKAYDRVDRNAMWRTCYARECDYEFLCKE